MSRTLTPLAAPPARSDRPAGPRAVLTLLPGGRNQPAMVAVERGELDEQRIELTVAQAERATFTAHVRQHVRSALLALAQVTPDTDAAEHWLYGLDRITEREIARLRAAA